MATLMRHKWVDCATPGCTPEVRPEHWEAAWVPADKIAPPQGGTGGVAAARPAATLTDEEVTALYALVSHCNYQVARQEGLLAKWGERNPNVAEATVAKAQEIAESWRRRRDALAKLLAAAAYGPAARGGA